MKLLHGHFRAVVKRNAPKIVHVNSCVDFLRVIVA